MPFIQISIMQVIGESLINHHHYQVVHSVDTSDAPLAKFLKASPLQCCSLRISFLKTRASYIVGEYEDDLH